jgi:hypothetical protein
LLIVVCRFDSNHCPLCPKIECVNCAFAAPSPCAPVVVDDLGCLLRTTKLDRNNCRSCPGEQNCFFYFFIHKKNKHCEVISCKSDCSINYRRIGILIDCNNCTCNPAGKLTCTSRTCRPAACRPAVVGCVNCTCESGVQVCSHGCNASAVVLIENLDLTIPILHDLLALFFVRHPDLGVPTLLGVEFVKNNISALVSLPVVASKKRDGLELMRSVFEENGYVGASYGTVSARTISVGPPITEPVVSGGLTSGMLAGIVIGVVMGVGLVVVLVGIGMTKRQKVAQKAVVTDAAAMTTNSMVTTNSVVIEDVHDFL